MADVAGRHADHDPLLVAGLLDGDLAEPERASAQARVDECPACAAIYADLLALSVATRTLPVPARPRDFRLTAADAARLAEEPSVRNARLTGVMTEPYSATSTHRSHDTTLVASLADHSLAPSERSAAEALVATCGECATLHADLLALVAATRAMPTPARPAYYTLTPADASRLRSPWRRLVAAFGTSRDSLSRPLAIGLSTLGLAGLLLASAPSVIQFGGATSSSAGASQSVVNAAPGAAVDLSGGSGAARAPSVEGYDPTGPSAAPAAPAQADGTVAPIFGVTQAQPIPDASTVPLTDTVGKGAEDGALETQPSDLTATTELTTLAPAPAADQTLLMVSVAFLLVGLGLFVLRWSARRLADG